MEYKIVSADTAGGRSAEAALEQKVNELIRARWEPIGGVGVVTYNDGAGQMQLICWQAVIRRP